MSRTSILDLPNELLNETLSYIVSDHHARVEFHDSGRWHSLPQILVLSSVCRQFRVVVFDLPFWYQSEFEFRNLVYPNTGNGHWSALENAELKLIQIFLNNEDLVHRFALKTDWKFYYPVNFRKVELCLPTFSANTKKITFSSFVEGDWLSLPVESLRRCVNITALTIDSCIETWYLQEILEACPLLEELELLEYRVDTTLRLVKNGLTHLRRLRVVQSTNNNDLRRFQLPLQCVGSLTDLSFVSYYPEFNRFSVDRRTFFDDLRRFSKLNVLELCPLYSPTCQVITAGQFSLTKLTFTYCDFVSIITEAEFVAIFSSPSLQSLSYLSMHIKHEEDRDFYWEDFNVDVGTILTTITQNLQLLEELELTSPLELEWLSMFVILKKLKRIKWDVLWDEIDHNPAFPYNSSYSRVDSAPVKQVIESTFKSGYATSDNIPNLHVTITGVRPNYWGQSDDDDSDVCSSCGGSVHHSEDL